MSLFFLFTLFPRVSDCWSTGPTVSRTRGQKDHPLFYGYSPSARVKVKNPAKRRADCCMQETRVENNTAPKPGEGQGILSFPTSPRCCCALNPGFLHAAVSSPVLWQPRFCSGGFSFSPPPPPTPPTHRFSLPSASASPPAPPRRPLLFLSTRVFFHGFPPSPQCKGFPSLTISLDLHAVYLYGSIHSL